MDFEDIIAPLSVARFTSEYWGRSLFSTALEEEVLGYLREALCRGEVAELAAECRKDDNSRYSEEEISGMAAELEEKKLTLNLPFCFAPGALEMKRAFIEACPGLGNDVEVGVYFSRAGGPPAQWHADNNHNVTIQICGQKDWLCIPGNPNTTCSRAMQEAPRNRYEQTLPVPPTGPADHVCHSLRPGSVLYVPPGHWHSVIPSGGDSCSVDLRVGNVLHAKWISEAVFAGLLGSFCRPTSADGWGERPPLALGPRDLAPEGLSEEAEQQMRHLMQQLPSLLAKCKLPRCFPFEPEHSDGLHTGATLAFLRRKKFMVDGGLVRAELLVGINALVAVTPKLLNSDTLVLQLSSTSSLSGVDYLRFSLHCPVGLLPAVKRLSVDGSTAVSVLQGLCGKGASGDLATLLRVLLHANVLYTEEAEGSPPKRRKKAEGSPPKRRKKAEKPPQVPRKRPSAA